MIVVGPTRRQQYMIVVGPTRRQQYMVVYTTEYL